MDEAKETFQTAEKALLDHTAKGKEGLDDEKVKEYDETEKDLTATKEEAQ